MLDPSLRAKQSTDTTGTGTLALNAAPAAMRSLSAAFGGVAARVRYAISWSTGFELGYGDFNGAAPGTLTRASVIASSNANALVALPVGTKDVFLWQDTGSRPLIAVTAAYTVTLADLGNVIHFTGTSAAALTLPAYATVPLGAGVLVQNSGSAAYTATANGAETIDSATTYAIQPGCSAMLLRVAAGWARIGTWPDVGMETIANVSLVGSTGLAVTVPSRYRALRMQIGCAQNGAGAVQSLLLQVQMNGAWLTATANVYFDQRHYNTQTSGIFQQTMIDQPSGLFLGFIGVPATSSLNGIIQITTLDQAQACVLIDSLSNDGGAAWNWTALAARSLVVLPTGQRIEAVRLVNSAGSPRSFTSGFFNIHGIRG